MNKFEAVVLFSPDLSKSILDNEEKNFKESIEKIKGLIINVENWGLKDLSYKINNYKKSFYKFYQIEMDGLEIDNLKKTLNQNEKILRHLLLKVENHQELPTKMAYEEK